MELDDILAEMKRDKEPLQPNHPLARGLRRGIGIYIDDVGMCAQTALGLGALSRRSRRSCYRRVVQRLAQAGKLAMVFSDHSLAYGVNMPFRTCAFLGEMPGLTPLMAQQMSGRSGRRGLDTQGNIVYLGMGRETIRELILGKIPDIRGRPFRYPTLALQALSEYTDEKAVARMAEAAFDEFQADPAARPGRNYFRMSKRLMTTLGLYDAPRSVHMMYSSVLISIMADSELVWVGAGSSASA